MATSTRYQRIRLTLNSPWNHNGKTNEDWSVMFSLSGATNLLATEMEPTAIDLFDPIKQLGWTGCYLKSWSFYPIQGTKATGFKTYVSSDHPCSGAAFSSAAEYQQLEVCFLAHAQVGTSATGKPKYLRKWIHGARSDGSGNTKKPYAAGVTDATVLDKWISGSGPRLLVPVSPSDGTQGAGWVVDTKLYTHQLRKGHKHKTTTNTVYVPVPVP